MTNHAMCFVWLMCVFGFECKMCVCLHSPKQIQSAIDRYNVCVCLDFSCIHFDIFWIVYIIGHTYFLQ